MTACPVPRRARPSGHLSSMEDVNLTRDPHPRIIAFQAFGLSRSCKRPMVIDWPSGLRQRRILPIALDHMRDDPVVLLEGPRSVGESTLLRPIAGQRNGRILDVDDPATLRAVRTDPATMLTGNQLVCIDEYQRAPILLDAIKAELNEPAHCARQIRLYRFRPASRDARRDVRGHHSMSLTGILLHIAHHATVLW